MKNLKLVKTEEPAKNELLETLQKDYKNMGRTETIDCLLYDLGDTIVATFGLEEGTAILALIQTVMDVCTSKWFLAKED